MMKRRTFLLQSGAGLAAVLPKFARTAYPSQLTNGDREASGTLHRAIVHPGILQTCTDLEFMKSRINAGEEPWKSAWEHWLTEPEASLDFTPRPLTHVVRGGYGAGQKGALELMASASAANAHALQWYVKGDAAHARKAVEIFDAWSGTLSDFSKNDAMLLAGWTGGEFANAAEILRATYPAWNGTSLAQFKRMLLTVYVPLLRMFYPGANGNWDAAIMYTLLSIGIFCEDRELMESVYTHFRTGPLNSSITRYVYPSGQCEETTRDQGHVQLGLGYMARTAIVAWNQGVDLFGEADNRLALGYEYTSRYMLGQEVPVCGEISLVERGKFRDVYEGALQHYRYVKNIDMTFTEQAAAKVRPQSRGVVMFFRGEFGAAPKLRPTPTPSSIAAMAGAQKRPSVPPPSNALQVAAGESIQAALDKLAANGGGVVRLGTGPHILPASLQIPSGITMLGTGLDCVLLLDPGKHGSEAAIVNAEPDLHDVVLRDFTIEGAETLTTSRDPNADVQQRRAQYGPARAGIVFLANGNSEMHNLLFERLTVRNCTSNAVRLFGADHVEIADCNFYASGGMVSPGHGKNHNLNLNHVSDVTISGARLTDSMWGHGVGLSFGKNVTIRGCELARNNLAGARIAESHRVTVQDCLAEGNSGAGIAIETWMDLNTEVVLRNNILRNNAIPG